MPDGARFRDEILRRYDFTPSARDILRRVPVTIDSLEQSVGGGWWHPVEQRIHLNGVQDEACVHELAHAWADLTQFYVDPHPHNPHLKGRHYAFRRDVARASEEADPAYRRVAFLAWEYTHGNPYTGFEGMGELDWERFAGLASGTMGDTRLMPPYLRRWYADLFGGHPEIPGPTDLPPWAPPGWRQRPAGQSSRSATDSPALQVGFVAKLLRRLRGG